MLSITYKCYFLILLFFTTNALALNLQSYRFTDSYRYSLLEDSLLDKFHGKYVATASYGYVDTPFYYSDTYLNDFRGEIIDANNVFTAGYTYYLDKYLAFGMDISAIHNEVFDNSFTSLGDTIIRGTFNFYRSKATSLAVIPKIYLPTGKDENFSTFGSIGGSLSIVGEKAINKWNFLASIGALSAGDNAYVDVDHRQLLLAQLGVSYELTDKLLLNLESYRNIPLVDDTLQDEGKYFLTAKHATHRRFSTYGGIGVSGIEELQRKTYSAFVGIKFHTSSPTVISKTSEALSEPEKEAQEAADEPIYFEHDEFKLKDTHMDELRRYVEYIRHNKNEFKSLLLEGFASEPGTPKYNRWLSRMRAEEVKKYLLNEGVPKKIISIKAHGESYPQKSEEWMNRKVEFTFN